MLFEDICEYIKDDYRLCFKSDALRNILVKLGQKCINNIIFYNVINGKKVSNDEIGGDCVEVNIVGDVVIKDPSKITKIMNGNIDTLVISIVLIDETDESNGKSLFLKDYFSAYEQISIYSIMESINNGYNVDYISTSTDDGSEYKIRVVEPDRIKIYDKYEAVPVEITQNNKSVIGSVEIKTKQDIDKIGTKVINRYSGFYNPIFNDILYFDDYININGDSDFDDDIEILFPYSNVKIDYMYVDDYGKFGVIKNMYYHKTNIDRSDKILTSNKPIYPVINEYALDYRDYNIFSSSWDEGYFITQNDLDTRSVCDGIGGMKDGLCMFGSKYLNIPDDIFVDTFKNGEIWDENLIIGVRDNTETEIMYKEINNRTVRYHLFIEKRLKRYLKEQLIDVFSKYIKEEYSFGNKGTIEDDVDEYVEKNLIKLYKIDKVYMYIKSEAMKINDKQIENEYLKYMSIDNDNKINEGFPYIIVNGKKTLNNNQFIIVKNNEFDRTITYNLKPGFKESFGFAVSLKRK